MAAVNSIIRSTAWSGFLQPCIRSCEKQMMKTNAVSVVPLRKTSHGSGESLQKTKYKVGVFGAGRISRTVHIKNILRHRRLELEWVVENCPNATKLCQDENVMHDIPFHKSSDTDKLLSDTSLDGVFVFSPTNTHKDYICKSLNQGKHVMTEKPCAESIEDIQMCYDLSSKQSKTLFTGFNRRYDETFLDMKQAMKNKLAGDVHYIRVTSRDSPKPSYEFLESADSSGCNIIADLAVHDINTAVWLTGCERPTSVYATTHTHDSVMQRIGQPDTALIVLKYPSGIICSMDIDRDCAYGYDMRIEIYGDKGMVLTENPRESSVITDHSAGASMRRLFNSFPERFEKAFAAEIDHFVDCMDGKTSCLVTKEECVLTSEIVSKALESYFSGQVVIF